jgi:ubiquinone/menaquinone biosynthesis C-methylase UbiE
VQLAAGKARTIRGVDYVPEMIDAARRRLAGLELAGSVEFAVGDATALDEPDGAYDAVVCIRVIINLGEWPNQLRGLAECARVLKPGGRFLLSEATLQGWRKLNALRGEWGLPEIPMPGFNTYLDETQVVDALAASCELEEIVDFASTYFVGTRVVKPLLAQASNAPVDVADPLSEWNRFVASLPAAGDYGTQKLFVFRKR